MRFFITGASSGIGRALVRMLCRMGHSVWGVARRGHALSELQREIGSDLFLFTECNVQKERDVDRVIREMEERNFLPDVVILNAGIYKEDLLPQYNHEIMQEVFATNLHGALIWVDRFLDSFLRRGAGQFIAISSIAAFRPDEKSASYPASKAALSMTFRSLRARYAGSGVFFTTVHFGPVATSVIPRYSSEKRKIVFALEPEKAASHIWMAALGKKSQYFRPFFPTLLFRISLILPDVLFLKIARRLRR